MVKKHLPLIAGLALVGSQVSDIKNIVPESLHSAFLLVVTVGMLYFSLVTLKGGWRFVSSIFASLLSIYIVFGMFKFHPIDNYRCNLLIKESESYFVDGDYASSYHVLSGKSSERVCDSSEYNKFNRLVQLSKANWKKGKQAEASSQVEQVLSSLTIENKPLLAKAYRIQGNIYNEQQKWVAAERSFNNAVKFGEKDFALIVDLAITKRRLDLNPTNELIDVVNTLNHPKNVMEREILISANRQLSSLSTDCQSQVEYLRKAYEVASSDDKLALIKTINLDDYVFEAHRCDQVIDKPDIDDAYSNGQMWLSALSPSQDRNKVLFNRADKYAMLLRDLALSYNDKITNAATHSDEAQKYTVLRDKSIADAERIVESGKQYINQIEGFYESKLRWQLTRATIANIRMNNTRLNNSLKEAQSLVKQVPKTNESNWGALAEYYLLSGQLLRDSSTVLKAYSIYYATGVGHDADFRRSQKFLENSGITGLPTTKTKNVLVVEDAQ